MRFLSISSGSSCIVFVQRSCCCVHSLDGFLMQELVLVLVLPLLLLLLLLLVLVLVLLFHVEEPP